MKEEPIIILSAISGVYVDMYRVKCAKVQDSDLTMLPNTIITEAGICTEKRYT